MYDVWVVIHKTGWIFTGNCTCMSGYAYILKVAFMVSIGYLADYFTTINFDRPQQTNTYPKNSDDGDSTEDNFKCHN